MTAGQTYTVTNTPDTTTYSLTDGVALRDDTTTVVRGGITGLQYRRVENLILNAGSSNDTVNIRATHREQSPVGKNSSFVVNGGQGNDVVNLGAPVSGGGSSLASFQIDLNTPTYNSPRHPRDGQWPAGQ